MLLDYRCHVGGPNATIGHDLPLQVKECMAQLVSKTSDAINWEFGYPALRMADAIRNRSRDMLAHGYEWTLVNGEPKNQPYHQYKWAPACCDMSYDEAKREFKVS